MRYAIEHGLGRDDRFWPITRQHAHTIVSEMEAQVTLRLKRDVIL